MKKKRNVTVATVLIGILTIGFVVIAGYINNIQGELTASKEQIKQLEEVNSKQYEEIDKLTGELEVSVKENVELEEQNRELTNKVSSLEKQLDAKEYPTQSISRGVSSRRTPVNITMTFYGDFAHENGGYAGIDANGNKLVAGTVASNYYSQGTQFEFNGQIFTVRDRGGSNFNNPNRLDVFVPRLENESDSDYAKRIRNYGVKKVVMYKR